jgi:serine/threonine protein kinase, bacterial
MHPRLTSDAIDEHPGDYLRRVGRVFAEFGAPTQDSGNLSYGVQIGGERYFVKTAGNPDDPEPFLSHAQRVALLRNAVRVSRSCRHPALPQLHAVIESPAGPLLVYAWVEGELLGVPRAFRDDPQSPFQRFRRLPPDTIEACLDTVYELHRDLARSGWVAVDFYDGCLIYDFRSGRLHVVDLDMYRQGPFRNEMGRMFGSSRFMAPEEFQRGSLIDEQTTVFALGRAAAIFLADGTLNPAVFRGSTALIPVIDRACQPDRSLRFPSMAEFYAAWRSMRNRETARHVYTSSPPCVDR